MKLRSLRVWAFGLIAAMSGQAFAQSATPTDDQRSLTIYQIMVASFLHGEDGAPGYKALWGPDGHTKNGNLKGITKALDHIQSLGANAIWLTPIFDSTQAFGGEKLQATGYFTNDFFKIDPNFGTEEDFRELVDEAHRRGMYVILDGVFGHHGGVTEPSPSGHMLDTTPVGCDRPDGGTGNIKYPESLPYIIEVATYWMDKYGVDGWRLDQAYQAKQGGHNYWLEIRKAVEDLAASRRERGERWGTLGYMVGEDWGTASVINEGVYKDGGLISAFDFDGKELISGPMQDISGEGLENGWDDVRLILSRPSLRGYLNDDVIPNLFLTNHDGYRVADHLDASDPLFYRKLMTRNAILAAYNGPVTLYYGDEFADLSRNTKGGQKDNIARTSGHLEPRNEAERELAEYIGNVMKFRRENPAMWRGQATFKRFHTPSGSDVLEVTKTDPETGNRVRIVFSTGDETLDWPEEGRTEKVSAWQPLFFTIK
ncbi:MAG: hypothetical protein K2L96_06780 [Muribaculaceae bacterium]|nr:hypothetical protein [Muribaculaceae bacterium]